jgi:ribose 1,5-bisphosphokinase
MTSPATRIVYVMGPSGAGKDSVMQAARARLDGQWPVLFAHRYATRAPAAAHPNEVALGSGEFALRRDRALFAFTWEAWDVHYAIGTEVHAWSARGLLVVVSGSRAHLVQALRDDPGVLPVLITAPFAERARRLRARAREDEAAIGERLRRGEAIRPVHARMVTIANDGPLERAATALTDLLVGEACGSTAHDAAAKAVPP